MLEPGGGRVNLIMGELAGLHSPGRAFSPLVGADILLAAGSTLRIPLKPAWEHALVVIEGRLRLDGELLASNALHYLGTQRDGLELTCAGATRAVLIGGAPFEESIGIRWNFVARPAEEIRTARDDWQSGNGFGSVKAYRGARTEAPELLGRPVASR